MSLTPVVSPRNIVCMVPRKTGCIVPGAWSAAGSTWAHVRYRPSQVWDVITEPSVEAFRPTMMDVQLWPSNSWAKSRLPMASAATREKNRFMDKSFVQSYGKSPKKPFYAFRPKSAPERPGKALFTQKSGIFA